MIRKELLELEEARQQPIVEEVVVKEKVAGQVLGEERLRIKKKRKLLVGGGTEETMDID